MAREKLLAGLAALMITGCGEKNPSSHQRPIEATRIHSESDYQQLTDTLASLEGHRLIRQETGSYEGYRVTASIYAAQGNAQQQLYALELIDLKTNERLYAATPLGKEFPFNRSATASRHITYTSEQLETIFNTVLKND